MMKIFLQETLKIFQKKKISQKPNSQKALSQM